MTRYLDSSSLVKLYVAEPDTDAVRRLVVRDAHFSTFDDRLARAGRTLLRELS